MVSQWSCVQLNWFHDIGKEACRMINPKVLQYWYIWELFMNYLCSVIKALSRTSFCYWQKYCLMQGQNLLVHLIVAELSCHPPCHSPCIKDKKTNHIRLNSSSWLLIQYQYIPRILYRESFCGKQRIRVTFFTHNQIHPCF